MGTPLRISVVTPSLDQGQYIEDAIVSVLDQQYPDFEHIVIDGGSTDQTLQILRRYPHLQWVSEPDSGQTTALNKGIRLATGAVVASLNADDLYRPRAFQAVAAAFRADPTIAVLAGGCEMIDKDCRLLRRFRARLDRFEDLLRYWQWGHSFCIAHPAVFLRRSLFEQVGLFNEAYDLAMDYEMWLRVAAEYPFTISPHWLAACRQTGQTKTQRNRHRMDLEQFRASRAFWRLAPWPQRWTIPLSALARVGWSWL